MTDADALDFFERLCRTQQPAVTPWQPVTDYRFEARKVLEEPHADLILKTFVPHRLLDYGCGHGHLLRLLAERVLPYDHTFYGYEPSHALLREAQRHVDAFDLVPPGLFDLVICREVLEHLTVREIRQTVQILCEKSSRYVYVTARFAHAPTHLLDVQTSDDLDPTHISLINQTLLRALFTMEGFSRLCPFEKALDWQQQHRVLVYERR
jgi:SAM-dependent methyltransferase